MPYDDDDTRPRRRSRRGRKRGSNVGMWVALGSLVLVFVVGGVVAMIATRKGGGSATGATRGPDEVSKVFAGTPSISGITPGAREITLAEFNEIKKDDTLASLEARFGPAKRWGAADLERVDYSYLYPRVHRNGDVGFSFARHLRETGNTNPECYYWSGGDTQVFVIPIHGHPATNLRHKYYSHLGRDEHGMARHTHSSMNFMPAVVPPLQPGGK